MPIAPVYTIGTGTSDTGNLTKFKADVTKNSTFPPFKLPNHTVVDNNVLSGLVRAETTTFR